MFPGGHMLVGIRIKWEIQIAWPSDNVSNHIWKHLITKPGNSGAISYQRLFGVTESCWGFVDSFSILVSTDGLQKFFEGLMFMSEFEFLQETLSANLEADCFLQIFNFYFADSFWWFKVSVRIFVSARWKKCILGYGKKCLFSMLYKYIHHFAETTWSKRKVTRHKLHYFQVWEPNKNIMLWYVHLQSLKLSLVKCFRIALEQLSLEQLSLVQLLLVKLVNFSRNGRKINHASWRPFGM